MRYLITAALLLFAGTAFAHDPGLSAAQVALNDREIQAVVTFNDRDIAGVLGEEPTALRADGSAAQQRLNELASRVLVLEVGGQVVAPTTVAASVDQNKNVEFQLIYPRPAGGGKITIRSALLSQLPFGHRQAFAARDAAWTEIARQLLSSQEDTATGHYRHTYTR